MVVKETVVEAVVRLGVARVRAPMAEAMVVEAALEGHLETVQVVAQAVAAMALQVPD